MNDCEDASRGLGTSEEGRVFDAFLLALERGEVEDVGAFCERRGWSLGELRPHLERVWEEYRRAHSGVAAVPGESARQRPSELAESLRALLRGHFVPEEKRGPGAEAPAPSSAGSGPSAAGDGERGTGNGERYLIEDEIGRGGMGVVLRVWDSDMNRAVAMKLMARRLDPATRSADLASDASLARFLDEAQVTGQLDHPGIVPVHELGVDAAGRAYFTMRLVEGRNLRAVFALAREGKEGWNLARAAGVLVKVCQAVAYAHSKRVVHRDLKPSNVMVGRLGEVYVMDWGLARVLTRPERSDLRLKPEETAVGPVRSLRGDDSPDSPLLTAAGTVLGTPAYMPPEQAEGRVEAIDERSDVYSLGAMLYTLLTGEMPYVTRGKEPSPRALLGRVLAGPPAPVHELAPEAPAELVAVCEKAMARQQAERYRTSEEIAEDLQAYLDHRVVRAYETGPFAELRKWVARNRSTAASAAAAVVLLVGGLLAVLFVQGAANRALREERDRVVQLADVKRLQDLESEAEDLWPCVPEKVAAMKAWIERADDLVERIDLHRDAIESLKRLALPGEEAPPEPHRFRHRFECPEPPAGGLRLRVALKSDAVLYLNGRELVRVGAPQKDDSYWSHLRTDWQELEVPGNALRQGANLLAAEVHQIDPPVRDLFFGFELGVGESVLVEQLALWRFDGGGEQAPLGWKDLDFDDSGWRVGNCPFEGGRVWLSTVRGRRQGLRFADTQLAWRYDLLVQLVQDLERFVEVRPLIGTAGTLVSVRERLAIASTIRERSIEDESAAWDEAVRSIADAGVCPKYRGLRTQPQLGLVPLGRDPDSGLWEFWHVQSGERPQRGGDGKYLIRDDTGLVLVLLPGGSFRMGSAPPSPELPEGAPNADPSTEPREQPVHEVRLDPFFASKYEMTQGQWLRIAGRNPSMFQPGGHSSGAAHTLVYPVEFVDWDLAVNVLRRLNLVLPMEAQWEYAARGGTTTVWWTGNEVESLEGAANLGDRSAQEQLSAKMKETAVAWSDGFPATSPVGSFRPNPFGLHDVAGNVSEWVGDGFDRERGYAKDPSYLRPVAPGTGERMEKDSLKRCTRGGSFYRNAFDARSARRWLTNNDRALDLGVRPARRVD
jgi:serine/threonine protein kinase/formylglycine-generating enzyme required for sulfatase activity